MLRIFNVKQGDQFSFTITFKNLQEDLTTFTMGVKEDYDDETLLNKALELLKMSREELVNIINKEK
jgi:hypothetical protein